MIQANFPSLLAKTVPKVLHQPLLFRIHPLESNGGVRLECFLLNLDFLENVAILRNKNIEWKYDSRINFDGKEFRTIGWGTIYVPRGGSLTARVYDFIEKQIF